MVFGTTYCAISHLPIHDGDKCILMPLGFNMQHDFDQWNKADINCFMYLYGFVHAPQEVIYQGNPDEIKYLDKEYDRTMKHQLYMLVYFDFFNAIQNEFMTEAEWKYSSLQKFRTCSTIYEMAQKEADEFRQTRFESVKNEKDEKKKNALISHYLSGGKVSDWVKQIYKVALFMDYIGMQPYPNHCVDQHERNLLYEKLRSDCINKTKIK